MEIWYLLITEKSLFWSFWKLEIRLFLAPKSWLKDDIYWLLKRSCFELSGDGKYSIFWSQEVDGKMIFTGYWEVIILNFSVKGNTVFFSAKKLMERWYLHVFFLAFYDIPRPGKYGFSRSVSSSKTTGCGPGALLQMNIFTYIFSFFFARSVVQLHCRTAFCIITIFAKQLSMAACSYQKTIVVMSLFHSFFMPFSNQLPIFYWMKKSQIEIIIFHQ